MNKKVISLLLASTLFVSFQMTNTSGPARAESASCVNVDNLVDVTPNHWAYDAVKYVVQEICILAPKTATRFMGNDVTTRYEVADAFYNAAKKLESSSGKDLKVTGDKRQVTLGDLDANRKSVVDSVVNEYGIMQSMPGNKFMGNEKMSRYELAFELNNYLQLLETKSGKSCTDSVSRAENLTDVKEDHWATPAVKNIIDKYQLMVGYPDNTFKGYQTLTRYELAAVLRKFMEYVDKCLIPITATPTPEATPTAVEATPTPEMTPVPEATPSKEPLKTFDLKVGGAFKVANTEAPTDPTTKIAFIYGPSARLDLRFGAFNVGIHGDYMLYDSTLQSLSKIPGLARLGVDGDIGWRMLGNESEEDPSFLLGIGYSYMGLMGTGYNYGVSGPKVRAALEIPLGSVISLFAEDDFSYFGWTPNSSFATNVQWKNEGFAGITIPAYTLFSVQVGYKDTRWNLNNVVYGDIGGLANLRFRF